MIVYPNRMSFDIMPGGGKPPEPKGMLVIKVKRVSDIHGGGDLFSKVRRPWNICWNLERYKRYCNGAFQTSWLSLGGGHTQSCDSSLLTMVGTHLQIVSHAALDRQHTTQMQCCPKRLDWL